MLLSLEALTSKMSKFVACLCWYFLAGHVKPSQWAVSLHFKHLLELLDGASGLTSAVCGCLCSYSVVDHDTGHVWQVYHYLICILCGTFSSYTYLMVTQSFDVAVH